jgi:exosortase/archaeosortase family protein
MQSLRVDFAVSIEKGCNGIEATIVLIAAMLAFPAPWKHKIIGILSGFVAVQSLNVVRVISLFYLGQWNKTAFDWAHLYVWQALIMLDVLIVFLIWIRLLPSERNKSPDGEMQALAQATLETGAEVVLTEIVETTEPTEAIETPETTETTEAPESAEAIETAEEAETTETTETTESTEATETTEEAEATKQTTETT